MNIFWNFTVSQLVLHGLVIHVIVAHSPPLPPVRLGFPHLNILLSREIHCSGKMSCLVLSPGRQNCVVLLGNTPHSHSASSLPIHGYR